MTVVITVLLVQSIRYLPRWQHPGRPVGVGLSRVVALFVIGMLPVQIVAAMRNPSTAVIAPAWSRSRAEIQARLEALPGQHLVIVCYAPTHGYEVEYVFNLADIDHEKVVWGPGDSGSEHAATARSFPGTPVLAA